jgi:hypothetical protein
MNQDNRFALFNVRTKLPAWLERRAKRAALANDYQRASQLCDLINRAENRLLQTSPYGIGSLSN